MSEESKQLSLADIGNWEVPITQPGNAVEIGPLPSPIWTETKAQLIQNYLRLFLYITKHGVYIDGFAGAQDPDNPGSWAAKLVLELEPQWLRTFFLCESNRRSFQGLQSMVSEATEIQEQTVRLHHGDFNEWIDEVLDSGVVTDNTATFALLDQRSTECHWRTVEKLASHKRLATKIELFYFFPTGWIHRALKETADETLLDAWWGHNGWREIIGVSQSEASNMALQRIQSLGYRDVKSWPISSRQGGEGRTIYHMIHATDHLHAPKLMYRAYTNLIGGIPPDSQIKLDLPSTNQFDEPT